MNTETRSCAFSLIWTEMNVEQQACGWAAGTYSTSDNRSGAEEVSIDILMYRKLGHIITETY